MKKKWILLCLLLLTAWIAEGQAQVLPEDRLASCLPIVVGDDYDPSAPVPLAPAFQDRQPQGELEIWFGRISVCDGFILRCNGETMLIDGGDFQHGQSALAFLNSLGVTGVDYIFNTHHHDDHLAMQVFLMNHGFTAREFLTPYERNYPVADQRKAEKAADDNGIAYHVIKDGDTLYLGGENGALLQFFRWGGSTNANYASVMCKVTFGERTAFLMADVIGKAQKALAEERADIPWKADILKAGHHGYTLQDPALLERIAPEICVVTNSRMGGKTTIDQMEKLGIPTLITNLGTAYFHTDGGENWYYMQDKSYLK